jgi:hypothetical protein
MKRFMNKKLLVVGVAVAVLLGVGGAAFAYFTSTGSGTGSAAVGTSTNLVIHQLGPIYDSTLSPLPGNMPSLGFDATGAYELGNEITLASTSSPLDDVVVDMSSWACQTGSGASCVTTPGATFPMPITFNIYNPASPTGSPIATDTQTFNIPYRPSSAGCTDTTAWYDATDSACYHGLTVPITFNFSSQDLTLPSTIVYGIEYSTESYGPSVLGITGVNGPWNSLNVELSTEPTNVTVGSDTEPGNVFLAGTQGDLGPGEVTCSTLGAGFAQYPTAACGPNGLGTTNNVPAVQFNVLNAGVGDLYPGGPSLPVNFSVYNPGHGNEFVNTVTPSVASFGGLVEAYAGDTLSAITGCYADWFSVSPSTLTLNQDIPAGGTIYVTGMAFISMADDPINQDACENATVGLNFSSN